MRMRSALTVLFVCVACLGPVAGASAGSGGRGGPTLWTFPSAECSTTLQDCIDHRALPGDTVEVEGNGHVGAATIAKSMTLQAGAGSHPSLNGLTITEDGTAGPKTVFVIGMTVEGRVSAHMSGGPGNSLTLRGLDFTQAPENQFVAGIEIDISSSSAITVAGSTLQGTGRQSPPLEVHGSEPAGNVVDVSVIGNHVTDHGADVASGGIYVLHDGAGTLRSVIDGNAVWDFGQCVCGFFNGGGIGVDARDGETLVDVVGNTVDRFGTDGLKFDASALPAGAHMTVDAFDDVVSHGAIPVSLPDTTPSRLTFHAGSNDLFDNSAPSNLTGHSPGTHNLAVAPGFLDETFGDLRLKPQSALVDAGVVCSPGGVVNLDAAQHGRLSGESVDMGGFERGAGPPTGIALVGGTSPDTLTGTDGADILCGRGGADRLTGNGGGDWLDGGGGPDVLVGGAGPDRMFGRSGNDACLDAVDGHGTDSVDGGSGTDHFRADQGDSLARVEVRGPCDP